MQSIFSATSKIKFRLHSSYLKNQANSNSPRTRKYSVIWPRGVKIFGDNAAQGPLHSLVKYQAMPAHSSSPKTKISLVIMPQITRTLFTFFFLQKIPGDASQ
jgi:hypothetical protein